MLRYFFTPWLRSGLTILSSSWQGCPRTFMNSRWFRRRQLTFCLIAEGQRGVFVSSLTPVLLYSQRCACVPCCWTVFSYQAPTPWNLPLLDIGPRHQAGALWPIYLLSYLSLRFSWVISCIVSCVFSICFFIFLCWFCDEPATNSGLPRLSSLLAELLLYYPPVIGMLQMQRSNQGDATTQRRVHMVSPWWLGGAVLVLCHVCRWCLLVLFAQVKEIRLRNLNYCLWVSRIHISY